MACAQSEQNSERITESLSNTVASEDIEQESVLSSTKTFRFNCNQIASSTKKLSGDMIAIRLTEEELEKKEFEAVEPEFYEKYIKNNSIFRKWAASSEEDYFEAKHYYWGLIDKSDKCILIIYEYFTLNHAEDKLFLMVFEKNGKLLDVKQVAEITHYPGAIQNTYSQIRNGKLTVYSVLESIIEYAGVNEKNQYLKDSTVLTYDVKNWNKLHQIDWVTVSKEYWQ